jgi:hypothetical protein
LSPRVWQCWIVQSQTNNKFNPWSNKWKVRLMENTYALTECFLALCWILTCCCWGRRESMTSPNKWLRWKWVNLLSVSWTDNRFVHLHLTSIFLV